jgi:hypothetical protein
LLPTQTEYMKIRFFAFLLIAVPLALLQVASCSKSSPAPAKVCDITGSYSGTNTESGITSPIFYMLKANNLAVGGGSGQDVTFGSYTNTCDSVSLTVYYTTNSDYYELDGKVVIDPNLTTITGTFKNLTLLSDSGTFILSK